MRARKTPLEKAAIAKTLQEAGYSSKQISQATGVPASTVRDIVGRHGIWAEIMRDNQTFKSYYEAQKKVMQAGSMELAKEALEQVEKKLSKASAYQATGIYSLLRQNARLDAGEATENVAHIHAHEVKGLDSLCNLLSQSLLPNTVTSEESKGKQGNTLSQTLLAEKDEEPLKSYKIGDQRDEQ